MLAARAAKEVEAPSAARRPEGTGDGVLAPTVRRVVPVGGRFKVEWAEAELAPDCFSERRLTALRRTWPRLPGLDDANGDGDGALGDEAGDGGVLPPTIAARNPGR